MHVSPTVSTVKILRKNTINASLQQQTQKFLFFFPGDLRGRDKGQDSRIDRPWMGTAWLPQSPNLLGASDCRSGAQTTHSSLQEDDQRLIGFSATSDPIRGQSFTEGADVMGGNKRISKSPKWCWLPRPRRPIKAHTPTQAIPTHTGPPEHTKGGRPCLLYAQIQPKAKGLLPAQATAS